MIKYADLLQDVVNEYDSTADIPPSTKAFLVSTIVKERKLEFTVSLKGEYLANVLYPHEVNTCTVLAKQLIDLIKDKALLKFELLLEFDFNNLKTSRDNVYVLKRRNPISIK